MGAVRIGHLLPHEIWMIVLRILRWDDRESFRAAGLCCRDLRELMLCVGSHTAVLKFVREEFQFDSECLAYTAKLTRSVVGHPTGFLGHIRCLSVQCFAPDDPVEVEGLLQEVIKRAHNLQVLKWGACDFSSSVIECLEAHRPHTRLVIESDYTPKDFTEFTVLARSSCLSSLTSSWRFPRYERDQDLSSAYGMLMDAICTAANLTILRLENYSHSPVPRRQQKPCPRPGDQFPNIEYLYLGGYFDIEGHSSSWVDGIQWQALQRLELGNQALVPFAKLATGRLSHLKSLGLFWNPSHHQDYFRSASETIQEFVKGVSRLETFATANISENLLLAVCKQHGQNLRSLAIHRVFNVTHDDRQLPADDYDADETIPIFFNRTLSALPPLLPDLEHLEVSIVWTGQWPTETIAAISRFPQLRSLVISIPMELYVSEFVANAVSFEGATDPSIDEAVCRDLYAMISAERERHFSSYQLRVSNGELAQLTSLDVKLGEWDFFCNGEAMWPEATHPINHTRLFACRTTTSRHATLAQTIEQLFVANMVSPFIAPVYRHNLHQIALSDLGLGDEVDAWSWS